MPLHLITRPSPRIQKKCCMKCLHRHILVDFGKILSSKIFILHESRIWLCDFSSYEAICTETETYTLWYLIQMCGFSKWCVFNEVHAKILFFVRCSNRSVIGFSTTYIHLFTCNIPLWRTAVKEYSPSVWLSLCTSSLICIWNDSTAGPSTYRMNAFGKYVRPTPDLK